MRGSTDLLFLILLPACATRHSSPAASPPSPPAIEARASRGELSLSLTPRDGGFDLRGPGHGPQRLTVSATGATVADSAGARLAELAVAPGETHVVLAGDKRLRITFPAPRGAIDVIDAVGVPIVLIKDGVARDAGGVIVAQARAEADRTVIEGRDGERLGTVHNLPASPDAPLAALLLSSPAVPEPARAALAAYTLSR